MATVDDYSRAVCSNHYFDVHMYIPCFPVGHKIIISRMWAKKKHTYICLMYVIGLKIFCCQYILTNSKHIFYVQINCVIMSHFLINVYYNNMHVCNIEIP